MKRAIVLIGVLACIGVGALVLVSFMVQYGFVPLETWVVAPVERLPEAEAGALGDALQERLQKDGCRRCSVRIRSDGAFDVTVSMLKGAHQVELMLTEPGHFDMVFVEPVPEPSGEDVKALLPGRHTEAPYYRAIADPIVTNRDFDDVFLTQSEGGNGLVVRALLNADGAERLDAGTRGHAGEILALVFDGEVRTAPRITGPLSSRSIQWSFESAGRSRAQLIADVAPLTVLATLSPLPGRLKILQRP
jgi:preprotein translocase subunit SecD